MRVDHVCECLGTLNGRIVALGAGLGARAALEAARALGALRALGTVRTMVAIGPALALRARGAVIPGAAGLAVVAFGALRALGLG